MMRDPRRGQAAVEMAILVPIFFYLLLGLFDIGRVAYTWATLSYAVREGARQAVLTGAPPTVTDAIVYGTLKQAANASGLPVSQPTCLHGNSSGAVDPAPATLNAGYVYILGASATAADAPGGQASAVAAGGCRATIPAASGTYPLTVEAVFTFSPITPFVNLMVGNSVTIKVTTTMNTEF